MRRAKPMDITEKENKLFAEWAQKDGYGNKFIKDGVPCPELFEKAKYKITFVLKESNDFDKDGSEFNKDMRIWIDEYGADKQGYTWNNITRWAQAILDEDCEAYPHYVQTKDRFLWLKRISFMNLKKLSGGASSNSYDIEDYAKKDCKEIYEQLKIYQPDIIICCGINLVGDSLHNYVFKYEDKWNHRYKDKYQDCCYFYTQFPEKSKKTAVLNCYHPQYAKHNQKLFDAIRYIVPEILDNR